MKISQREMLLAMMTLAVLLVALTLIIGKPVIDEWKDLGAKVAEEQARYEADMRLIESRGDWEERFVKLGELMPAFPAEKKMDIHWLSVMDQIASKNGLVITKRQAGEEKKIGDVYELTIEIREWEGTLDALVHFLFDLQGLGVMLDVKQLYVKPLDASKLRGRFTLNCAYSKKSGAGRE